MGRTYRHNEMGWAAPNDNPETVRCGYVLNSHPAVLDGFIDLVREDGGSGVLREKRYNRPVPLYGISSSRNCLPAKPAARRNGNRSDNYGKA